MGLKERFRIGVSKSKFIGVFQRYQAEFLTEQMIHCRRLANLPASEQRNYLK